MNANHSSLPFIGTAALLIGCCILLFTGMDGLFKSTHNTSATIIRKEYQPPVKTYSTQIIGGRTRSIPQQLPECFLFELRNDTMDVLASVPKQLYRKLSPGDQVHVTYSKRRISGRIDVLRVRR